MKVEDTGQIHMEVFWKLSKRT